MSASPQRFRIAIIAPVNTSQFNDLLLKAVQPVLPRVLKQPVRLELLRSPPSGGVVVESLPVVPVPSVAVCGV